MSVSLVIPAYQAADTIAATVRAARTVPGVSEIIVVDDGSRDGTADSARGAGADHVIVVPTNCGKGAALAMGARVAVGERLLFLDADLDASAAHAAELLTADVGREAMVVGVPPSASGKGGFGLLRWLARASIRLLAGIKVSAPLSGQRSLSAALVRHIGIAPRFGAEVGLTVEASHVGSLLVELPVPFEHRHTARTVSGFRHRGRQFRDVLRLVLLMGYGIWWPALSTGRAALRLALWSGSLLLLVAVGRVVSPATFPALAVASLVAALAWMPCLWVSAVWLRLRKSNYLGRSLPAAAGIIFPLVGLPFLWFAFLDDQVRGAGIAVMGVLGAVGLLDDLFASGRQARGLRGHLLALVHGRLTTGAVKALSGLAVGIAAGLMLDPGRPAMIALDALLIALTANLINLLDLRPGRALKGFGLLAAAAVWLAPNSIHFLGPLLAAALVSAPADLAGRTMMGDVGANVLGGVMGLVLAIALPPWARLAAVALLVAFHLFCERVSLSDLICRNSLLRAIDRLGTDHLPPLAPEESTPR